MALTWWHFAIDLARSRSVRGEDGNAAGAHQSRSEKPEKSLDAVIEVLGE